jgi:sucrose phosphorylase
MKNQIQLITYADRLGGNLDVLSRLLDGPFAGLFGGVHILPFFTPIDGSDAGFDPIDHTEVDARIGSWSDVRALGERYEVMADLIVNHVSTNSPQFRDYSAKREASEFNGLFLRFSSVFPTGATEEELLTIYRPRPGLPFTYATLADGSKALLWTTFTSSQVDIDVTHPCGRKYLDSILDTFAQAGIRSIRLDAAGYAIKLAGTSCFMIPETFSFIDELAASARRRGMEVLVEIHSYYRQQVEIAKRVDRVYDFALPPLVLHALVNRTAKYLKAWLAISPRNAVTVLDTHDGIGVIDVGAAAGKDGGAGLMPPADIDRLVEQMHERSRGQSRKATGAAASNLDLYQVNCTYYDALGRDDRDYLLARAIQFFAPGVPQVYYVGLLAGENDMALLERTQVGRDINRHYYTVDEIDRQVQRPVVQRLFGLMRWRNTHPAFAGEFSLPECGDEVFVARWSHGSDGEDWAELRIDFAAGRAAITDRSGVVSEQLGLFE